MPMDSSLLIAAGASFVAGVCGYIIAKLWIKPIVHYNVTKRKLDHELSRCLTQLNESAGCDNHGKFKADAAALQSARQHAMDLVSSHAQDIPYWYRLLLDSRRESPAEASGLLTNLSKIRNRDEIKARIDTAREKLGLD